MRANVLGITIDTNTMRKTVERICHAVEANEPIRVVTANPEMIYASKQNHGLKELMNSADIVTADGIGVVWAARQLGNPVQERVTGIDLVQALLPVANAGKWRIFFLGGKPGVAEQAVIKVTREYPGIKLKTMNGYFSPGEEISVVETIRAFHPDVLLVGLGAPRQEYWIAEHPGLSTIGIGVGGSFDALAGTVIRAPKRIQDLHVEWLYRLWKEPWRWKRQTVLPRFVLKVMVQKIRQKLLN